MYVELRIIKKDAGKTATITIQRRSENPVRVSAPAPMKPEPQHMRPPPPGAAVCGARTPGPPGWAGGGFVGGG
jgi:hypothetical protein